MVAPLRVDTGMALSPAMVSGEPFSARGYSIAPILAVPEGSVRFCVLTALTTSFGDSPLASSAAVSRSTEMTRVLPPKGNGIAALGTVTSRGRIKL